MPLKHVTETRLVFLLGLLIAITGIVMTTLPNLPLGLVPWSISFLVAVLYPVVFYPLLKNNRADYEFRSLHWFPAAMLLVWMLLQIVGLFVPTALKIEGLFTWAWSLLPVALGFLLLLLFCLGVIRRRGVRTALLLLVFLPFTMFAIQHKGNSETHHVVAKRLWGSKLIANLNDGTPISADDASDVNLDPSEDPSEQAWRDALAALEGEESDYVVNEDRDDVDMDDDAEMDEDDDDKPSLFTRIRNLFSRDRDHSGSDDDDDSMMDDDDSKMHDDSDMDDDDKMMDDDSMKDDDKWTNTGDDMMADDSKPDGKGDSRDVELRHVKKPAQLPNSGFGMAGIGLTFLAGYCGVLHDRVRRRRKA